MSWCGEFGGEQLLQLTLQMKYSTACVAAGPVEVCAFGLPESMLQSLSTATLPFVELGTRAHAGGCGDLAHVID